MIWNVELLSTGDAVVFLTIADGRFKPFKRDNFDVPGDLCYVNNAKWLVLQTITACLHSMTNEFLISTHTFTNRQHPVNYYT